MRATFPTLLISLALVSNAGAEEPGRGVFPYPIHEQTLENGLRVLLVPMGSEGLVSFWSIVRTGSRDEVEPGRTGFAHFFEHMMFRGTERFPSGVYDQMVTELGADANAFTTDDFTAYYLTLATADLERALDLESDRFRNLSYPEEIFRTEAGAVYGEYRKVRTNPFFALDEALRRKAFVAHTYGHSAMGFESDIQGMPDLFDYSRQFFERYYRPDNVVLLFVGDLEVEPTLEMVRKYYGDWQPGYVEPEVPREPEQQEERRLEVDYDGRTLPWFRIAYKAPAFDPGDATLIGASLLTDLAFGPTSEIYRRLVLEEQVLEFLAADLDMQRDPGLLDVYGRVKDPARVEEVLAEIDRTIERYQRQPPDPERLRQAISRRKYGFLMSLDTPASVAGRLARIIAVTGGVDAVEEMFRSYERLTPADVQRAAREILVPQKRTVAVLRGRE